jgi:[phosphatase 2A protein]-leucine-carboxy methyltransferase
MSDQDEAIRQTDYDALSSRLSCFLKGYNSDDKYVINLIPLILYYQLQSISSEFRRFALTRKLKSQFFNLFPIQHINLQSILQINEKLILSKINRFTPLKSPMINRGTYLRTCTISNNINQFLLENISAPKVQIISLGAGNDTRPFSFLPQFPNLHYFELDVENTTRLKKLAILSSPELSSLIGTNVETNLPRDSISISQFDPNLHTSRYHLISYDLRNLSPSSTLNSFPEFQNINSNVPTLIISECCICYLSKIDSNNLILFWRKSIKNGKFLIYEPLGGSKDSSHNYGEVMVKNLICRGIEMPTLIEYGTVESQIKRFNDLMTNDNDNNNNNNDNNNNNNDNDTNDNDNINNDNANDNKENSNIKFSIFCKDMKWVYDNQIDIQEKDRLSKLEMLDELEELNLINSHYCLIIVKWNF